MLVALNNFKRALYYIWEGEWVTPETIEPAIKELKAEEAENE